MSPPSTPSPAPVSAVAAGGRAILWAQVARFFLRLGSAAGLARLLTPDDYGLNGMASIVYGLLYMARDFGIVTALQQPGDLASRFAQLRRMGLLGGCALLALGVLAGWPAAWFYHEPRLPAVLAVMSLGFLAAGLGAPAVGLLYREQRLATLARCEVTGLTAGTVTALAAAWGGLGVWSLVLLSLVTEVVQAAACWRACSTPAPAAVPAEARWRELLGFGASLTGHGIASYFFRTGDQIVAGWSAGTAQLGLYGRGAQIAALPMQLAIAPFNGWAIAGLAHLRPDPAAFADFFRRTLNGLLHVSGAAGALCLVAPDLVIRTFFGERWLAAVPVLRWLALGLAVQPLLFAQSWLLESTGQVRRLVRLSLLGTVLVGGACLLSRSRGLEGIALAAALALWLQALAGLALCQGCTPVRLADMARAAVVPALVHGGWAALVLLGRRWIALPAGAAGWGLIAASITVYYGLLLAISSRLRREIFGHFLLAR